MEVPCYLCGEEVVVGDDYISHVQIVHGVEYDETKIFGKEDISQTSTGTIIENSKRGKKEYVNQPERANYDEFIKELFEKIGEIKDLVEGKVELDDFSDGDHLEEVGEEDIDKMFENLKSKIMSVNPPTDLKHTNLGSTRKWYQGTYFNCEICQKTVFGEDDFRKHLVTHEANPKTLQELKKYSTHFEEALYTCKVCVRNVKHEIKNILCHVQNHCSSLEVYEDRYVDIQEELRKLPVIRGAPKEQAEEKLLISDIDDKSKAHKSNLVSKKQKFSNLSLEEKVIDPPLNELKVPLINQVDSSDKFSLAKEQTGKQPKIFENCDQILTSPETKPGKDSLKPVKKPKSISVYHCPLSECKFTTTKEGMKNSEAALHLKNEHGIKACDMKPGMYKFEKSKKFDI